MRATVERTLPTRLLPDPDSVRDFGSHRAAHRAMRADILANGDLRAGRRRRAGLRLSYACKPHSAEHTQGAGNQPGPAQEIPAVQTDIDLMPCGIGERAAASMMFMPFDQHQSLLNLG